MAVKGLKARRKVLAGSPTLTLPFGLCGWQRADELLTSFLPSRLIRKVEAENRRLQSQRLTPKMGTTLDHSSDYRSYQQVSGLPSAMVSQPAQLYSESGCEASDQTKTNNGKHQPKRCPVI